MGKLQMNQLQAAWQPAREARATGWPGAGTRGASQPSRARRHAHQGEQQQVEEELLQLLQVVVKKMHHPLHPTQQIALRGR